MLTDRYSQAFAYAADLHRTQLRKGTATPYLTHLMAVSVIVLENDGSEEQAIAALLHDAVEDQGGLPVAEDIRARFGDGVARIVLDCTDTHETPKPAWGARKEAYLANARLISDARRALDAAGRGVVALSPDGDVVWATPRAEALLSRLTGRPETSDRLRRWIGKVGESALSDAEPLDLVETRSNADVEAGAGASLIIIGRAASGDILARVTPRSAVSPAAALSTALGVSEREGEVLAWLAQGKSNRDIAAILALSPRTVTKHVETIFAKIGVENRTAAAARAIRTLAG